MAASERCGLLAESLDHWLEQAAEGSVYWVEVSTGRRRRISLASAPIEVAQTLRDELYRRVPTCILTSATLSIGRDPSFEFFQGRLGLDDADSLRLGSPFDYREQAKIHIAAAMPDPGGRTVEF